MFKGLLIGVRKIAMAGKEGFSWEGVKRVLRQLPRVRTVC